VAELAGVRLKLEINQYFRAFDLPAEGSRRHTLIVVGYRYALLDAGEREILAYHWHPIGRSAVTQPHLHLGPAAQVRQRDLAGAHLATGVISLADVVEMLIKSFDVEPRLRGWREIIAEARAI
jgi:hypothetical protein